MTHWQRKHDLGLPKTPQSADAKDVLATLIETEEAAKRLARVIISDIQLYNKDLIASGGDLTSALHEGRHHFKSRVNASFYGVFDQVAIERKLLAGTVVAPAAAVEITPSPRVLAAPAEPAAAPKPIVASPPPARVPTPAPVAVQVPPRAPTPAPLVVQTSESAQRKTPVSSWRPDIDDRPTPVNLATPAAAPRAATPLPATPVPRARVSEVPTNPRPVTAKPMAPVPLHAPQPFAEAASAAHKRPAAATRPAAPPVERTPPPIPEKARPAPIQITVTATPPPPEPSQWVPAPSVPIAFEPPQAAPTFAPPTPFAGAADHETALADGPVPNLKPPFPWIKVILLIALAVGIVAGVVHLTR